MRVAKFIMTRDTTESVVCTIELRDGQTAEDAVHDVWHELSEYKLLNRYADRADDGFIDWQPDDWAGKAYVPDDAWEETK